MQRIWNALVAAVYNALNNSFYNGFFSLISFLYQWGLVTAPALFSAVLKDANLAGTYANGSSGVGATLTKASAGALAAIDGVTPTVGMTVLLTGQSTPAQNGLYSVTNVGSSTVAWVLTRWGGWDQSAEMINGSLFLIQQGTTYGGKVWAYTAASSPTVGVTSLTFAADSLLRSTIAVTVNAVMSFAAGTLRVMNSGGTFGSTLASNATAARTVTLPDASFTVAQVGGQPTTAVNYASPAVSGTGMTAAGQVMTSTDNKTATLNQYAGCWLVCATHGPYLIASNTAVSGAPLVLTIYGDAPTTDAGTYKILQGPVQV